MDKHAVIGLASSAAYLLETVLTSTTTSSLMRRQSSRSTRDAVEHPSWGCDRSVRGKLSCPASEKCSCRPSEDWQDELTACIFPVSSVATDYSDVICTTYIA